MTTEPGDNVIAFPGVDPDFGIDHGTDDIDGIHHEEHTQPPPVFIVYNEAPPAPKPNFWGTFAVFLAIGLLVVVLVS